MGRKARSSGRGMSHEEQDSIAALLRGFQRSSTVRDKALAIYVSGRVGCFDSTPESLLERSDLVMSSIMRPVPAPGVTCVKCRQIL